MKTFLAYLAFAGLLTLCYIEKISAEAAKRHAVTGRNPAQGQVLAGAQDGAPVTRLRE